MKKYKIKKRRKKKKRKKKTVTSKAWAKTQTPPLQ